MDLGESRPQELWRKAAILPKTVHWHLVGHLQRNKIERTLPLVRFIHSVDSLRLLEALEKDGRVFLSGTKIHGKKVLRACSVNHRLRREDVDYLLDVIRDVGRFLVGKAQSV